MIVALSIIALLIITLIIGKINLSIQFNKEVKQLFSASQNISEKTFNYDQLEDLPEPIQRYFKNTLKDRQPYISFASITHDGQFKTGLDKNWINITGEQYATTQKPGFIWKGTTYMFTARDMYIADKGRLVVSLFGLCNIVDGKGEKYNQGELLRWLGESVLYPTNFLPNERLQWSSIDSNTAKLSFQYKGLSLFFRVSFNKIGEIKEMETKRFMNEDKLETWVIKPSRYKEMNDINIPTAFEVFWRLEKGDFSYAKFNITKVEYNNPYKF